MTTLAELLPASVVHHRTLCPCQVLGVRMGMRAGALLDLDWPQADKRLLTSVETDGCVTDGIAAATFTDMHSERALRSVSRGEARTVARQYAPGKIDRWRAQLAGYQRMPDERYDCSHTCPPKSPD